MSLILTKSLIFSLKLSNSDTILIAHFQKFKVIRFNAYINREWWRNEDVGPFLEVQYLKKSFVEDPHPEVAYGRIIEY